MPGGVALTFGEDRHHTGNPDLDRFLAYEEKRREWYRAAGLVQPGRPMYFDEDCPDDHRDYICWHGPGHAAESRTPRVTATCLTTAGEVTGGLVDQEALELELQLVEFLENVPPLQWAPAASCPPWCDGCPECGP